MAARRRNKPKQAPAGSQPVPCAAPDLPATYTVMTDGHTTERVHFLKATREFYESWVDDGERAGFGMRDWLFLRDMVCRQFDIASRTGSKDRAVEVRQQVSMMEGLLAERASARSLSEQPKPEQQAVSGERRERLLTVVGG